MPKLTSGEIQKQIETLMGWRWEGKTIVKEMTFPSFKEAMSYVNRVAELAEKANHHPDIAIHYRAVTLTLYTHTEDGLTQRDFRLATQIDAIQQRA